MKGQRLNELREEKQLKQSDLAKMLNISSSSVGMYERNQIEPDDELKLKIANFFDVSVDYLMGKTNKRNASISHEKEFIDFYEDYKELEDDDKDILKAIFEAIKKKK